MRTGNQLDREKEAKLRQFNILATTVVAVVTLLAFWAGLYVLQHDVFKDYYNPERHVIVQQDPETLEVYAWRDSAGHVFTRDSATVRLFPYGIMTLLLLLMGFSSWLYNLLMRTYTARLVREVAPEVPVSVSYQRVARG
ncbi:hypothetical protein EDD75_0702 [Thermodesulfitimonas autotrophica]|uniref:Uncharacterized protein n=1 Tax=Thermodesulfitimonas autotrophica TaxID=1894989 RepID=A0A3N5AX89_9THEO|nr:hypothetical protein [Thermodesulfitimonas autotrophica]RPF49876.1 hypothetical protein EDD75_0702 [Thermodesulfitimonas autotrophica]